MTARIPLLDLFRVDKPNVGLVDESRRLQRVTGALALHVAARKPPQFVIDQRSELLEGRFVSDHTPSESFSDVDPFEYVDEASGQIRGFDVDLARLLAGRLADAYRQAGWGLGHTAPASVEGLDRVPSPSRLFRIDYVWHSDHWQTLDAHVGEWDGQSDHLSVFATLQLQAE